ncbi:hypothetical protein [Amycolatopsis cihanbeyliensis]|uniref:Uncharacterized protein n=1 Tax=Amycolatopsis cihanbeyliensis TaxID=1128664 RepID=A0A542CUW5_AMYCI|nr:hypothetical protein [Amycolatopsis cihanbeyliensis]TQI94615.1 hypothetical protein FB471_6784 [Amycolatopsis cihanbeyliensis]
MSFPTPVQAPPVQRPALVRLEDLAIVREAYANSGGDIDRIVYLTVRLRHHYNFNDPPQFAYPGYDRMAVSAHDVPAPSSRGA